MRPAGSVWDSVLNMNNDNRKNTFLKRPDSAISGAGLMLPAISVILSKWLAFPDQPLHLKNKDYKSAYILSLFCVSRKILDIKHLNVSHNVVFNQHINYSC